jgi:hypothetical protein
MDKEKRLSDRLLEQALKIDTLSGLLSGSDCSIEFGEVTQSTSALSHFLQDIGHDLHGIYEALDEMETGDEPG